MENWVFFFLLIQRDFLEEKNKLQQNDKLLICQSLFKKETLMQRQIFFFS